MKETATQARITRPITDDAITVENAPRLSGVQGIRFSPTTMSDLFFNYEHPAYSRVMSGQTEYDAATDEEISTAILADARDFCSTFFGTTDIDDLPKYLSPEAFAKDFLRRL